MFNFTRLSLALLLLVLCAPLRAEPAPQGQFLLGTYMLPDTLLPRYVTLRINGSALTVNFSSEFPLNYEECDQTGNCLFQTDAASATIALDNGAVSLSDVKIDQKAIIESGAQKRYGDTSANLYAAPLMAMLQGARLHPEPYGFRLNTGGLQLAFYRGDETAFAAARALPLVYELSIAKLAGCEVRAIVPLFQNPAPNPAEARFLSLLRGFNIHLALERENRRLNPIFGKPTPENRARARSNQMASRLPVLIANIYPDANADYREPFWNEIGTKMFRGDRAAYDAALALHGDALDDLIAFHRHLRATEPEITPQTVCADPSLGFGG